MSERHWTGSYHGVIAICAMLVLMISNGLILSGLGPFRPALIAEFGWTAAQISRGELITFLLLGVFAPFIGILIDRFGTRVLMQIGMLALAGGYYLYGTLDSLNMLYAIHVLFAIVLALAGLVPVVALVSRWFDAERGTAIGVALVGSSLASFVFPPIAEKWLIPSYGWRDAFQFEAIAALIGFAIVVLLVRSSPAERGLKPYGAKEAAPLRSDALPGLTVAQTVRTMSFWVLGGCAFLTFFAMLGTLYQLPIYLGTVGVKEISLGYMAMLGAALIGKFLFGFLADRLGPKRVFIANMAVMAIGAALLAIATPGSVFLALAVFGIGWGGLYTMLQLLTVENFGLKATGKIMGLIAIFDCVGGGLGSFVMASIFDATQSYRPAFWMLCGMIVVALIAATRIRQEFRT